MSEFHETNRRLWDGWTEIHRDSPFYDVDAFRAGASSLNSIELEAVGEVAGTDLIHLQCHFGLDTLSWARRGARVTGVDFSDRAIALARELSVELEIPAEFHCLEVTELPPEWSDRFDVAFTSYGVLPWLPDLGAWAESIARVLRPGGAFHLVEFHPFSSMLDDTGRIRHPYFHTGEPDRYQVEGSYADPSAPFRHDAYEWAHSLSEIHQAIRAAGLEILDFKEYPFSPYGCYPYLEESEPGRWTVRESPVPFPLVFSIHATKRRGET
jgi:SAM-dependent methyltransferase